MSLTANTVITFPAVAIDSNLGDAGYVAWGKYNTAITELYTGTGLGVANLDPTGSTDSAAGIQAAITALAVIGGGTVTLPTGLFRCSSALTIPAGVTLFSSNFCPSNPYSGSGITGCRLIFDLSVVTCVTIGGVGANNGSCSMRGISILRAVGTPPTNSVGILVQATYTATVVDCASYSHQVCFKCLNTGTGGGITTMVDRLFTGAAYDAHVVIDTLPEVRFNQCRFGMNGPGDQACLDYVRFQGGSTSNAALGPHTTIFVNCQWNQGVNTVTNCLAFRNQLAGNIADVENFVVDSCYIESDTHGIFTDSTWPSIPRLAISNTLYNPSTTTFQFINVASTTDLSDWRLSNCMINCQVQYTSATNHINGFLMDNCIIKGAASFNGVGSAVSRLNFSNNQWQAGLTLTGSFTTDSLISGGGMSGGSLVFTASGIGLDIAPFNIGVAWTPGLTLGGGNSGMTGSFTGAYTLRGRQVLVNYKITLTAKGSSTGVALVTGLPYSISGTIPGMYGTGNFTAISAWVGLTNGVIVPEGAGGTTTFNLRQPGATGYTNVADTNI